MRRLAPAAAPFLAALLAASPARAQDPATLAPRLVAAESPRLRVLAPRYAPGEGMTMHDHPARVVVALTDVTIESTAPDGTTRTVTRNGGSVSFHPPMRHSVRNAGPARAELVEVELRGAPGAPASAAGPLPARVTTELENDQVRVLRIRLAPGESADLPLGEHAAVPMSGPDRGRPRIVPRGMAHLAAGDAPFETVIVEPRPSGGP